MREDANYINKYIELPKEFMNHVIDLRVALVKQSRSITSMAKHKLIKENDKLREFVIATAETNEKTEELLFWMKELLQDICDDANIVIKGAEIRNQLKDQSDTIVQLMNHRNQLLEEVEQHEIRRIKAASK
jgi:mevalonate kinase